MALDEIYRQAASLLANEDDADAVARGLALLQAEVAARPDDAKAWFTLAGAYDGLGREAEALPHYERVAALGVAFLPAEDQPRLYLQQGSTLRNLQRLDEARAIIQEGMRRYPDVAALPAFLALVEYSAGRFREAARLALKACADSAGDASLRDYRRALTGYVAELDTYPAPPVELAP